MTMNTWDKCKNCGGERGLHHYQTDQCPVGGREAPIGRTQEWKTTTFEIDDADTRIAILEAENAKLKIMLQNLVAEARFTVEYLPDKRENLLVLTPDEMTALCDRITAALKG